MKGDWEGIPGEWIDDPTAIDGQRFVAAPGAIREMRQRMRISAKKRCEFCGNFAYHGDRHHVYGRGIGGGKKEDRPQVNGVRFVLWCCRACHEEQTIKPWGSWALVNQRSFACKGLVICMVLFCAYMQWSPVVDLDYVWINGYEHYVGAATATPHQMGSMVLPALPQPFQALLDDFAHPSLRLPLIQSTQGLVRATTLRL